MRLRSFFSWALPAISAFLLGVVVVLVVLGQDHEGEVLDLPAVIAQAPPVEVPIPHVKPRPPQADDGGPQFEIPSRETGDLDEIVKRRTLRVLTSFSRTNYFFDGVEQRGLTYDLLKEFERQLNRELKTKKSLPIHLVIVPVPRDQLIPLLADGRGDIAAANLTITPERAAFVEFSRPYLEDVREVIVTGPASPPVVTLDDLSGQEIHARRSSSYWASLEALNRQLVAEGHAPAQLVAADETLEDEDLLELVSAGSLPLAVVDDHKAKLWASILDGLAVHQDLAVRTGGKIAWALRKGTPKFKNQVDKYLEQVKSGTTLGNILQKRYLVENEWARNPLASDDMKRFRKAAPIFKEYSGQYAFDWRMIAAQGYQESRLDQRVKSSAGAIGVMQVLPKTAAAPEVGVRHIEKLDNNIHAGTKYLRILVDRYFAAPDISERDRLLFAMAAYNAGPTAIQRVRDEATRMGLDSDRWFDNVEYAAARVIGRETTNYVRNIAKYYYAYRLVDDALPKKHEALGQFVSN